MKNIPKDLKEELNQKLPIDIANIINIEKSVDGSIKYLFQMKDKTTIEAVLLLMRDKKRDEIGKITKSEQYTFCISSQVGCKVGCTFCLTAKGGFTRDLTAGEIVAQVMYLKKVNNIDENKSVNIVYMGMGEPLDNYNNLVQSIKILSDENGLNINTRRQTISTSGISSKIDKLTKENLGIQLAISLHAVDDELRSELIPMNKAYNIQSIIDAVKKFPVDTRKKIMFEYLVIKDKNDDIKSASKLAKLLSGIEAKVNLIYFNPFDGVDYQRPSRNNMIKFQEHLLSKNVICTIRESKGLDISAACGQLKEKNSNKEK
jgi:23S rRNA (adenine2503-C2)-methyltransferase